MTGEKKNDSMKTTAVNRELAAEREQHLQEQLMFSQLQKELYGDKKTVEIISMLMTVLKEVGFSDQKLEANLEKKLYNKVMEYSDSDKKSNLIK